MGIIKKIRKNKPTIKCEGWSKYDCAFTLGFSWQCDGVRYEVLDIHLGPRILTFKITYPEESILWRKICRTKY